MLKQIKIGSLFLFLWLISSLSLYAQGADTFPIDIEFKKSVVVRNGVLLSDDLVFVVNGSDTLEGYIPYQPGDTTAIKIVCKGNINVEVVFDHKAQSHLVTIERFRYISSFRSMLFMLTHLDSTVFCKVYAIHQYYDFGGETSVAKYWVKTKDSGRCRF